MVPRFLRTGLIAALLAIAAPAAAQEEKATLPPVPEGAAFATFAGGCFWCVEADFDGVPGVLSTTSGYTGGHVKDPSYDQVTHGDTGHYEAVRIVFDPGKVSFATLLDVFWHSVDPTDAGGQFCDRGPSYRTAIFVHSDRQRRAAEKSKMMIDESGVLANSVVTPVLDAGPFYPAEEYHQEYYKKNAWRYGFYRFSCRRDARLEELWGDGALKGIEKH